MRRPTTTKARGVVAAGHRKTAEAAKVVLEEGGNAFDAVLAAQFAACVVEPVFTSLGGGGFLLAHTAAGQNTLYDFFTQTPLHRSRVAEMDFYPIDADFGTATQRFHIGMGSIATPGTVKGLFKVYEELCTLPIKRIMEPAMSLARHGVRMNQLQAYSFQVLESILTSTPAAFALYRNPDQGNRLLAEGELLRQPELGDTLEALADNGAQLFYRGEVGQRILRDSHDRGGSLSRDDLYRYRVIKRKPLAFSYRGAQVQTNPPPSSGGVLIAFTLKLLEQLDIRGCGFGSAPYIRLLARTMETAQQVRAEIIDGHPDDSYVSARRLMNSRLLDAYRTSVLSHAESASGTTHISVIDKKGNLASLTTSNGEGSGYVIPGTGIMLNNMLGEEDINPRGFHKGTPGRRLSSMVSPTVIFASDRSRMAMGSGGSNRIRTAMLQVLLNLIDFKVSTRSAVNRPRIHFENGLLSVEAGFGSAEISCIKREFADLELWDERNLFFGGVHIAGFDAPRKRFAGAGDPRRGGVTLIVN